VIIEKVLKAAEKTTSLTGVTPLEIERWAHRLVCILGPSGVGKTALACALVNAYPDRFFLLGSTVTGSRGTVDIRMNNYRMITEEEFLRAVSGGDFLHWNKTKHRYYGIEKRRLREAVSTGKTVLVIYRSLSGGILKSILPALKVLELRAPVDIISTRLSERGASDKKTQIHRIKTVSEDLAANADMYHHWSRQAEGRWYPLYNDKHEPPVSTELVEIALKTING